MRSGYVGEWVGWMMELTCEREKKERGKGREGKGREGKGRAKEREFLSVV